MDLGLVTRVFAPHPKAHTYFQDCILKLHNQICAVSCSSFRANRCQQTQPVPSLLQPTAGSQGPNLLTSSDHGDRLSLMPPTLCRATGSSRCLAWHTLTSGLSLRCRWAVRESAVGRWKMGATGWKDPWATRLYRGQARGPCARGGKGAAR